MSQFCDNTIEANEQKMTYCIKEEALIKKTINSDIEFNDGF